MRLLCVVAATLSAASAAAEPLQAVRVVNDRAPDCSSLAAIVHSVTKDCTTDDERAIAIYNFSRYDHYHHAYPSEPGGISALKLINVYGWSLCGGEHTVMAALWEAAGYPWRDRGWSDPGHTTVEVSYGGRWHYLDTFLKFYAWMPDPQAANPVTRRHTLQQWQADLDQLESEREDLRGKLAAQRSVETECDTAIAAAAAELDESRHRLSVQEGELQVIGQEARQARERAALKEQENIYYYPQGFYEIGNPGLSNRYHKGTTQNQNPANPETIPAIITGVNFGDTYLKLRDMKYIYVATDDNYSDYYTSNFYGLGRPNIYDSEAKRVHLISGMRYSGRLLENTKINELNKFVYDDLVMLKSRYGTINKIIEAGDVLKVLQDRKETSIYVGKEEMDHPDGSVTFITSNKVLGSQNSYDEERGTLFP